MKGHNPEKAKSGFTILRAKANVFRLREQDFTTLPEFFLYFSFLAKFYDRFFRLQMVHLPKIFSKTLFEMLISLTSPKCPEVYVVNNPCSCYIGTCRSKNPIRNYYSNQNVAPRHIQTLIASVEKADESCSRKRNKTLSHKLKIRLSQLHYKKANCGNILGC